MMKLTMMCPECEAEFDEGLVAEVGDMDSVDLCEFEGPEYTCQTCGYKVTLKDLVAVDDHGLQFQV